MKKHKWALYLLVLQFELKVAEIGGSSVGDHRQYPTFRKRQNEAHRMQNARRIRVCAST